MSSRPASGLERRLVLLVTAVAAATVLGLFSRFGIPWDEPLQAAYGRWVVGAWGLGPSVPFPPSPGDLQYYGPMIEGALHLGARLILGPSVPEAGLYDLRHLQLALLAVACLPAVAFWARRLGPDLPGAAPFAALSLITMPRFVGHAFTNSKDLPFAVAHVVFLLALVAWLEAVQRGSRWVTAPLALGAALGLALATRPGALPWLGVEAGAALLVGFGWPRDGRRPRQAIAAALGGLGALGLGWAILVAPWPFAWQAPFARPLEAMRYATSFPEPHRMLFAGRLVVSTDLPWHYPITYLLVTVPLPILALALVGAWTSIAPRGAGGSLLRRVLTLVWVVGPLTAFALLRPPVYDGLRHFLFVLPGVAVLAGLGAARIFGRLGLRSEGWPRAGAVRIVGAMTLTLAIGAAIVPMVRLHPYQAAYFNAVVGGLEGASERWDTDYWAASHREAARWLADSLPSRERPLRVGVAGNRYVVPALALELPAGVEIVAVRRLRAEGGLPPGLDAFVASTRLGAHLAFPDAPVVHRVRRAGATLAVVRVPDRSEPRDGAGLSPRD